MSKTVAEFEKVPFEQFYKDALNANEYYKALSKQDELVGRGGIGDDIKSIIKKLYDDIAIPQRATSGSAGYDIRSPFEFILNENVSSVIIPTGLRCKMESDYFLGIMPRSGSGFKFGIRLANTIGIIDSDYYFADNSGHIMVKLTYESVIGKDKEFKVNIGDGIAQGIFIPYGVTINDSNTEKKTRTGGFGSTGA